MGSRTRLHPGSHRGPEWPHRPQSSWPPEPTGSTRPGPAQSHPGEATDSQPPPW